MTSRRPPATYGQLARIIAHAADRALRDGAAGEGKGAALSPDGSYEVIATHLTEAPGFPVVVAVVIERLGIPMDRDQQESGDFGLTPREAVVASLLREGRSNASIAEALSISAHTVKRHVERVLAKLRVRTRAEAAAVLSGATDGPELHARHKGKRRT